MAGTDHVHETGCPAKEEAMVTQIITMEMFCYVFGLSSILLPSRGSATHGIGGSNRQHFIFHKLELQFLK